MDDFKTEFLSQYLRLGLGSLSKGDIDALVMHLIDRHGHDDSGPLAALSNQSVSERLHTPVARIKKLRYDAALRFGGNPEDQARGRLLAALSRASVEADGKKVCLIIEDTLARNWLQGQLKQHQQIFDFSFNTEIVKVEAEGLFKVLASCFSSSALEAFRRDYDAAIKSRQGEELRSFFAEAAKTFVHAAAEAAGGGVIAVLKAHLPLG